MLILIGVCIHYSIRCCNVNFKNSVSMHFLLMYAFVHDVAKSEFLAGLQYSKIKILSFTTSFLNSNFLL